MSTSSFDSVDRSEEHASAMDGLLCCRLVARVELPLFRRHRRKILFLCLVLTCAGTALSVLAFFGAYARARFGLEHLPWLVLHDGRRNTYAGVLYLCTLEGHPVDLGFKGGDGQGFCRKWTDVNCPSTSSVNTCEGCKVESSGIAVSVLIAAVTYFTFLNNTYHRYTHDSPCKKFTSVFTALVGGGNFMAAIVTFTGAASCS
eukprot:CAMPEP_0117518868 /NCGR_PEP_ID=MMETSP0784-20121206/32355_1 /TAXON_ID=39447 /ORGANISM="" /LENGTH=201 /DNA_ID=CAMNT_0005314805 /DNA_START=1 /DNA_END=607 /DNA_ORIENTATION=+